MSNLPNFEALKEHALRFWGSTYGLNDEEIEKVLEARQRNFDFSKTLSIKERSAMLSRKKAEENQRHLDYLASRFPARSNEEQWLKVRQRPEPQPFGISWQGAEALAKTWLEYLGEANVSQTQLTADDGVDVLTEVFCCQVKNYESKPVSVQEVREIVGVAHVYQLKPLIFSASELSPAAQEFANRAGVAVIQFHATSGTLFALNELGRGLLLVGKYSDDWSF